MWDVQRGAVHEYEGGYSDYVFARAERERIAATEEAKRQNLVRKELAWLRRGAPARTSKPRYRIEAANELIADVPPPRDTSELMKFANARLGKTVFDLEDVTVQAGPKLLLKHLTWQLGPGDRIGLVGVNGAGKTSLLRALAEAARRGATSQPVGRARSSSARPSSSPTSPRRSPNSPPALRVLEAVQQVRDRVDLGKGREMTAGQLCEQFGFTKEKQWTPVGDLSGGERRRLQLLRLLMDEPNVLFLDEPTNDLDIETLTQLEDLLDGWPGSHGRHLPRPVLHRADHRPACGRCSATPRCGCCRAASTSTWSAGGGWSRRLPRPVAAPAAKAAPRRLGAGRPAPRRRNSRRSSGSSTRSPSARPLCTHRSPITPRTSGKWPNWTRSCAN